MHDNYLLKEWVPVKGSSAGLHFECMPVKPSITSFLKRRKRGSLHAVCIGSKLVCHHSKSGDSRNHSFIRSDRFFLYFSLLVTVHSHISQKSKPGVYPALSPGLFIVLLIKDGLRQAALHTGGGQFDTFVFCINKLLNSAVRQVIKGLSPPEAAGASLSAVCEKDKNQQKILKWSGHSF